MFVQKSLVAFLLLCVVSSVFAHPLPQGLNARHTRVRAVRRGANGRICKPRPVESSSLASVISTPTASSSTSESEAPATTHAASSSAAPAHTAKTEPSSVSSSPAPSSSSHSSTHPHPSTSSSSSQPAETHAAASPNNHVFAALAPIDAVQTWSTASSAPNPLTLSDASLHVTKVMTALPHPYVNAPDGVLSMKATYPEGSWNFDNRPLGGLSLYAYGPDNIDLTTAKEVTFGYSVYFEQGFQFNIGGKLPGIFGGNSDEEAFGCSGGRRDDACFSSRLMWREDGAGELYTYLPPDFSANQAVCDVAPKSECNPTYGASVGRGSFFFKAGQSNAVSMRVRLNDVGKENGELELFANGKSVINVGGLVLRNSDAGRIRGLMVQTFFGGSTQNFASPKTQSSWFRDFTVAITEKL